MYALEALGLLTESATAVGVGVGAEQLAYYLASRIASVTATDIYGVGDLATETAPEGLLNDPARYARTAFRRERLHVAYMDGRKLEFDADRLNFAFSFFSIEHFGGHEAAARALREMERVVRPGGAVVVTTEVILNGASYPELFHPSGLLPDLIGRTGFVLVDELNYTLTTDTLRNALNYRNPDAATATPHVLLNLDGVLWTSICLVRRKPPAR